MLLTFSGLDGSGKTTIIRHIKDILNKTDKVCISYTIYFDISIYGIIRKIVTRSDKKKTAIQSKNQNNNKMKETISNKLLLFFRNKFTKLIIIYLDSLIAWGYVIYYCYIRKKILIIDRYYYDFLIDLESSIYLSLLIFRITIFLINLIILFLYMLFLGF